MLLYAQVFLDQIDDDFSATGFGGGVFEDTCWLSSLQAVSLTPSGREKGCGVFTSRLFNAGVPVEWKYISWVPYAPYGKELPDNNGCEYGYPEGNADMRNNLLLLHFNGSLNDSSGNGFSVNGSGVTDFPDGKFGKCAQFSGEGSVEAELSWIGEKVALELWFKRGAAASPWAANYGTSYDDYLRRVRAGSDGLFLAGSTQAPSSGADDDVWVVKLDFEGNVLWSVTFGGSSDDFAWSVCSTDDGGCVVCGATASVGAGGKDGFVTKLDSDGNIVWQKVYGGSGDDQLQDIKKVSDGFILCGTTYSFGSGGYAWLLKIDSSGNVQWSKVYGGSGEERGYALEVFDDGYVVVGGSDTFSVGSAFVSWYIFKVDLNGNLLWARALGDYYLNIAFSVAKTASDEFVVSGMVAGSNGRKLGLVKMDSSANCLWQVRSVETAYPWGGYDVCTCSDGGVAVAAMTTESGFSQGLDDYWVLRFDKDGNNVWQRSFGDNNDEEARGITCLPGGGFAVSGYSKSFSVGLQDAWVITLDSQGQLPGSSFFIDTDASFEDPSYLLSDCTSSTTVTDICASLSSSSPGFSSQSLSVEPNYQVSPSGGECTLARLGDSFGIKLSGEKIQGFVNSTLLEASDVFAPCDGWNHVVLCCDGNDAFLYVNGDRVAEKTLSEPLNLGSCTLTVGENFAGCIDELVVFSRVLDSTEVLSHYKRGVLNLEFSIILEGSRIDPVYSEALNGTLTTPAMYFNLHGSQIRYEVTFKTCDSRYSPLLKRVELGPSHSSVSKTVLYVPSPNPFVFSSGNSMGIVFDLPEEKEVELSVFNILGEKVDVVFKGRSAAGRNVFYWDGRNNKGQPVPAGLYLVVLKTDREILKRKFAVLR